MRFHSGRYGGNNLVNAMAVGLAQTDKIFYAAASGVGNPIVYLGSKTGRDGIHGATMASAEFGEDSEEKRPTVQVGDPFSEKLLLEACLEIMAKGCVIAIQDMGAAGLTCSAVEMGAKGDLGVDLDLDTVLYREDRRERLETRSCSRKAKEPRTHGARSLAEKEEEAEAVFRKWGNGFTVVGRNDLDQALHRALRRRQDVMVDPADRGTRRRGAGLQAPVRRKAAKEPVVDGSPDVTPPMPTADALEKLIGTPDLCSKRWVWEQYDHVILGNTVQRPGGDAAVVRRVHDGPKGARAHHRRDAARYVEADPYEGAPSRRWPKPGAT